MGCYLAIGLKLTLAIRKKDLADIVNDEVSSVDILKQLEEKFHLKGIYTFHEEEDYYIYKIKDSVLEKEAKDFLRNFYKLRYVDEDSLDGAEKVLEDVKDFSSLDAIASVLKEKRYQTFQEGDYADYIRILNPFRNNLRVFCNCAILSLDGKIIMECYGDLFKFLRRCIVAQLSEYDLSQALDIWIDG